MALLVAGPPAPGPDRPTVPNRLGVDLDAVRDAVGPPERAVGRHRGRDDGCLDGLVTSRRGGEQLDRQSRGPPLPRAPGR